MHIITYKEIISIVNGFSEYISKMKSKNQYVGIIKEYLLNEVRNQVDCEDYTEFFSEERIKAFHLNFKRSLVVKLKFFTKQKTSHFCGLFLYMKRTP